jgi:hypothetical protein
MNGSDVDELKFGYLGLFSVARQTVFSRVVGVFASWVYADSFFLEVYINWYGNSECEVKLVTPYKTPLFSYFSYCYCIVRLRECV